MTTYTASAGTTLSGIILAAGDTLTVMSGGIAVDTVISSGGTQIVSSGGLASGASILSGGSEQLLGGTASGGSIARGGSAVVSNGGVLAGGTDLGTVGVYGGGTASAMTVSSGGRIDAAGAGALLIGDIITASGLQTLLSGATASSTSVYGGTEAIGNGGLAVSGVISGGTVSSFGSSFSVYGFQSVVSGGVAIGTTVLTSGYAIASGGGVLSNVTVSGGLAVAYASGTVAGGSVASGLTIFASGAGATVSGVSVASGASLLASAGGALVDNIVSQGGSVSVFTSGSQSGTRLVGYFLSGSTSAANVSSGQIMVSALVTRQAVINVFSGGASIGTRLISGSIEVVSSGGVASGTVMGSGTTQFVIAGGSSLATQLQSGGLEIVSSGGTAIGANILTGGGVLAISGGVVSSATVSSGGALIVSAGGTAIATTLLSGGAIFLRDLAPVASGGSASFDAVTSTLTVVEGANSATLTLAGDYTGVGFAVSSTAAGVFITDDKIACFARGTRICTPGGEIDVEKLAAGDLVRTWSGKERPIVWVGTGRALITPRNRCDVAPVIVRAGALSDGVPARDLHVTRHHAVLVDDLLVPVEHSINDVSVVWDDQAKMIEYYHIELDTHDILIADGAPAESFRDDESAHLFNNSATRGATTPQPPCAPVVEHGAALEDVWRLIADRAGVRRAALTRDPDLHLVVDGTAIRPADVDGEQWRFDLPVGARRIAIASRHVIPSVLGTSPDRRRLGVALSRITLRHEAGSRDIALDDPALTDGFTEYEDGHRWTKGHAELPARVMDGLDGSLQLELQVIASLRYRAPGETANFQGACS